jgi:hypothetical protein
MTHLTAPQAANAIYVDFESLGNTIDRPAILGSLTVDESGDRFRQFVLDDRLREATVARRDVCISASAEETILTIVDDAERHSRVIVSWSMHDAEVVTSVCSPDLVTRFCELHRNALDTAKPWKRAFHPTFPFNLKKFGGKHPLKEYLRMTGYPLPASVRSATPAKWLRHTIQQVGAHDGRYKRITQEARRDWHKLLLYNEHDCRGMRSVVMLAARQLDLWAAYRRTSFVVMGARREITIRAGSRNPALDRFLAGVGATRWAFLTAYNPESRVLSGRENTQRQRQLVEELVAAGYSTLRGEGRDPTGEWTAEPSLLVLGIGRREARAFGRQFGQLAIVTGYAGFPARLVASGLSPGTPEALA